MPCTIPAAKCYSQVRNAELSVTNHRQHDLMMVMTTSQIIFYHLLTQEHSQGSNLLRLSQVTSLIALKFTLDWKHALDESTIMFFLALILLMLQCWHCAHASRLPQQDGSKFMVPNLPIARIQQASDSLMHSNRGLKQVRHGPVARGTVRNLECGNRSVVCCSTQSCWMYYPPTQLPHSATSKPAVLMTSDMIKAFERVMHVGPYAYHF